jgi:hypothetical protein
MINISSMLVGNLYERRFSKYSHYGELHPLIWILISLSAYRKIFLLEKSL